MKGYEIKNCEKSIVIGIINDLDATLVNELKVEIKDLCIENCSIILDLEDVDAIDSYGVAFLISLFKSIENKNGEFLVVNASLEIFDFFDFLKLNDLFTYKGV